MISLDDCIGFSGLSAEQVDVVAMRMHIPTVIAAEWVETVMERPGGPELMESFLADRDPFSDMSSAGRFACECLRMLDRRIPLN